MNNILAAALFSAIFAVPAFAEDAPPSMADFMQPAPAMMGPGHMNGPASDDQKGDCDSAGHGMHLGSDMMGSEHDDCDSVHGKGDHHVMGMNGDDCDFKFGHDGHHRYDMDDYAGKGRMKGYGGYGMGGPGGMMGPQGAGMMLMQPNMRVLETLDLSKEQSDRITKISDKLKHDNWATQGLFNDETAKLRDLYEADRRDPSAIGREYQKVFDLKRKMIETYLEAENRIEDVLTPDQLEAMKDARGTMRRMYEKME
jgi:Spy/CpxP family protein refolding chaperone